MPNQHSRKIVVMTGATSGIGAHALEHLIAQPDMHVIIGARGAGSKGVEVLPLDLASLASVRAFAEAVKQRLGGALIDMLVLNAGAQYRKGAQRSADGFEATFAVNHLAHYLLARLLLSSMVDGGRLVITTSDTHDPAILPFAPKVLEPQQWAHPDNPRFAAVRAYSASKLCNLLTARAFAALDDVKKRHIQVIAYNPGLTVGTKLGRQDREGHASAKPNAFLRAVLGFISTFKSAFYPGTPERAGEVLAQLALGAITLPPGRVYASLVRAELTFPDPAKLAQSDEARDRLWRESAAMVGLPEQM
jgi:NAD(P)-dependent dehydrogenase (short-subunit alcohol dehydrogenase family)